MLEFLNEDEAMLMLKRLFSNIEYYATISYKGWVRPHTDKDPHKDRLLVSLSEKPVMFYCGGKFELLGKGNAILFDCTQEHALFSYTEQKLICKIYRCWDEG